MALFNTGSTTPTTTVTASSSSSDTTARTTAPPDACQVCGGKSRAANNNNNGRRRGLLLRCAKCQSARYCSVDCQRKDWKHANGKDGHFFVCRTIRRRRRRNESNSKPEIAATATTVLPHRVQEAQRELMGLVSSLSVDEATQSYHQSVDETKRLQQERSAQQKRSSTNQTKAKSSETNRSTKEKDEKSRNKKVAAPPIGRKTTTTTEASKTPSPRFDDLNNKQSSLSIAQSSSSPSPLPVPSPCWDFYVENLARLSCYQIVILLDHDDDSNNDKKTGGVATAKENLVEVSILAPPHHHNTNKNSTSSIINNRGDFYDRRSYVVVRIAESNKSTKSDGSRARKILQLALPPGIVIIPPTNNQNQSIPYTMDTTMNGQRQRVISIRLRYANKDAIDQHGLMESPTSSLLMEEPITPFLSQQHALLTPDEANRLACRACGHFLFQSEQDESISIDNDEPSTSKETLLIDRVLPMPSGRWEEMADYLMCYEGQAAVDFSSSIFTGGGTHNNNNNNSTAMTTTLLQDETTLVLSNVVDKDDKSTESRVSVLPNVSRLAIPGFGQVPGSSSSSSSTWRANSGGTDGSSNACHSLACNLCCSVVGEAQPEEEEVGQQQTEEMEKPQQQQDESSPSSLHFTYRFWKHRLVVVNKNDDKQAITTRQRQRSTILLSTLVFLVQELIRLAETKAIFTLACFGEQGEQNSTQQSPRRQVMVLRLVSWGDSYTSAATSSESSTTIGNDDDEAVTVYPLNAWQPMAKILFEIRDVSDDEEESLFNSPQKVSSTDAGSNDVWNMFNQTDWCCPPPPRQQTRVNMQQQQEQQQDEEKKASNNDDTIVAQSPQQRQRQVLLESWEWNQVRNDLQEASRMYGKQVVSATFLAKTGRSINKSDSKDKDDEEQIGLAAVAL